MKRNKNWEIKNQKAKRIKEEIRIRTHNKTYIVIIGLPHFQPARTGDMVGRGVAVADNIGKGVAASPLAALPSAVTLHSVSHAEVVPGPEKTDSVDGRIGSSEKRGNEEKRSAMHSTLHICTFVQRDGGKAGKDAEDEKDEVYDEKAQGRKGG